MPEGERMVDDNQAFGADSGVVGGPQVLANDGVPITSEDGMCSCGNALPCGVEVEIDGARYVRHDNILDEALHEYRANYGDDSITKDDIFYYVYGLLHSPLYVARYQNNLRRELPRIPMAPDFSAFCAAGRTLSELHLNYETCPEYPLSEVPNAMGERPKESTCAWPRPRCISLMRKASESRTQNPQQQNTALRSMPMSR